MYLPMTGPNPRKRPAPGSVPAVPLAAVSAQMQNPYSNGAADQMLRWGNTAAAGADAGAGMVDGGGVGLAAGQAVNPYGMVPVPVQVPGAAQYGQAVPSPSNALARRQMNRALVPTAHRAQFDASADAWAPFVGGDDGSLMQQPPNGGLPEHDNVEELEELALKAKREAQAKRKQIPPFVQKLSRWVLPVMSYQRRSRPADSFAQLPR